MRTIADTDWVEIIGAYVHKMGQATHEAYEALYQEGDGVKQPINAIPLAALLSDGVLGFLASLNDLNKKEAGPDTGVDRFDIIKLFTNELFIRLTDMGYTTCVNGGENPDEYKQVLEAMDNANAAVKDALKH